VRRAQKPRPFADADDQLGDLRNFGVTDRLATKSAKCEVRRLSRYLCGGQAKQKDENGVPCHNGLEAVS
jgi:hypothetical protein